MLSLARAAPAAVRSDRGVGDLEPRRLRAARCLIVGTPAFVVASTLRVAAVSLDTASSPIWRRLERQSMSTRSRLVGTIAGTVLAGGVAVAPAWQPCCRTCTSKLRVGALHLLRGHRRFGLVGRQRPRARQDPGTDGLVYYSANVQGTITHLYQSEDTGKTYTNVYNVTDRDQQVTD